jgi:endoglucanase
MKKRDSRWVWATFVAGVGISGMGCGGDLATGPDPLAGEPDTSATASALQAAPSRALDANTRFFVPPPNPGAVKQVVDLIKGKHLLDAARLTTMEATPKAAWFVGGTPAEVQKSVGKAIAGAKLQRAVPVLVAYNIPGRDCGGYSGGGAQTPADYAAWIDAFATGIGAEKAVVILEPDGVALSQDKCGNVPDADKPARQDERNAELNAAIDRLELQPQASVYLDAGHSHWLGVGEISQRLITAGVQKGQGFFVDVSNYRSPATEDKFGTWISKCIAFGNDAEEGGWRLGHFDWCASQYYSPFGPVNPDDITTWGNSDQWFDANMGTATATTHFVIDTSRSGQGPWHPTAAYPDAQDWCNPPGRGVGPRPTVATGNPLANALLWVKIPGESDGSCNRGIAGSTTDPEWGGIVDPAAGEWFPQQALELARLAQPPLF